MIRFLLRGMGNKLMQYVLFCFLKFLILIQKKEKKTERKKKVVLAFGAYSCCRSESTRYFGSYDTKQLSCNFCVPACPCQERHFHGALDDATLTPLGVWEMCQLRIAFGSPVGQAWKGGVAWLRVFLVSNMRREATSGCQANSRRTFPIVFLPKTHIAPSPDQPRQDSFRPTSVCR